MPCEVEDSSHMTSVPGVLNEYATKRSRGRRSLAGRPGRILGFVLIAGLVAAAPGVAEANGRYPVPVDVHFKPGDSEIMALAVTWGLLITKDGGDTWGWVCEGGVGFGGVYDPDYAFTSTGLLLATTTSQDGLRLTRDFCAWDPAPAPLGSPDGIAPATFVSQVEVGADGAIYAAAASGTDSQIYVSTDDGATFAPLSNPGGGIDWWESLAVARTPLVGGNTRLYLTGYDLGAGGVKTRVLFRSDDSASSWTQLAVTAFTFGGNMSDLQIAAVSPDDPNLVFARVYQANGTTVGDAIYRSANGGASWTKVFEAGDDIPVVLVRRDPIDGNGDVVVATRLNAESDASSGLRVSTDGGVTFGARQLGDTAYCLGEREDGVLFSCSDGIDDATNALSRGTVVGTYAPVVTFDQVDDVIDCPAGTHAADTCDPLWCGITAQFGIPGFADACAIVDAGLPVDGGNVDPPDKSCTDCSGGGPGSTAALAVLAVVPLLRRRRRK